MEMNNPQNNQDEAMKKIKQKKAPKGPAYGPAPNRRGKKPKFTGGSKMRGY